MKLDSDEVATLTVVAQVGSKIPIRLEQLKRLSPFGLRVAACLLGEYGDLEAERVAREIRKLAGVRGNV